MKKMITLCALVASLALASTAVDAKPAYNEFRNTPQQGEVTIQFYPETYVVRKGAKFSSSDLGTFMDKKEGVFDLYTGGREKGTMEFYNADDHDNIPDAMLIRRANKEVVCILLDTHSPNYEKLKQKLSDKIMPYVGPKR
jgi:hypothetical protein